MLLLIFLEMPLYSIWLQLIQELIVLILKLFKPSISKLKIPLLVMFFCLVCNLIFCPRLKMTLPLVILQSLNMVPLDLFLSNLWVNRLLYVFIKFSSNIYWCRVDINAICVSRLALCQTIYWSFYVITDTRKTFLCC